MPCLSRETGETRVHVCVETGKGELRGATGIPFFDHMLETFSRYSGLSIEVSVQELKRVDDHHVVEDVAIVLGRALDKMLGDRKGIRRFGYALIPMDDALAYAAVDLARRPYFVSRGLQWSRDSIGGLALENVEHFLRSLAFEARFTLHVGIVYGSNDHHKVEALFKAVGIALREAMKPGESISTKDTLL
ncbi:Imidazoleglycerol-phosphate dehydratase [Pyrolobus fumarii 1A]|uniref:Imidazoleglycerol-phosphate dehydratase n=1 Tax=Pyrolobus fumarii (strain DSM 11204 / 1A) TaxID=694429 RepID=G0ECK8_PYRF1|nr:imidazoleglycerol-phosphate dehydratase [Pyrolobus fumarii]AEM39578.1 Imidazoleglycerol-phosphate dehydratase [Pyrolobus fumarii 1A]